MHFIVFNQYLNPFFDFMSKFIRLAGFAGPSHIFPCRPCSFWLLLSEQIRIFYSCGFCV